MSFPVAPTPAVWVSDLGLTWCGGCRSGVGKFIAGRPFCRVEQLKLHRSITNSWSASMISAGFRALDDFRAKIASALRRLQAVPNIVRAFFAHPDLHYINA
jgi:hypothetical protein